MADKAQVSRGITGYACGVAAGCVSAFVLSFALAHSGSVLVLFAYLAAIPLFMSGLGAGVAAGAVAAICGAAGLFAFSLPSFGFFYVIADAIPAIALSYLAMRHHVTGEGKVEWSAEGHLLMMLAIYPCLIFLGVYAITADQNGGLLAMTIDAFNGMGDQVNKMLADNGQDVTPEMTLKIHQYFETCARITPALAMCAWMFSTIIAMAAGQAIVQQKKWNLRPAFSLAQLHVPNWVIFAAAVTGLVGSFAPPPYDYIGLNLALVLGVPFLFVGLAVVHAWAATTKWPTLILVLFYTVISVIVHLILLVAIIGAIDQWVDFRKRFSTKPTT